MKKDYKYWMDRLQEEEEASKKWREEGTAIEKFYEIEDRQTRDGEFNILWANTETMHSVLFSSVPKANVTRRFKDNNPTARIGAEILERALDYTTDQYDFKGLIDGVVNNFLLPGLGTVRVRYKPYYEDQDPIIKPVEVHSEMNDDGTLGQTRYFSEGQEISENEVDLDDDDENYIFKEKQEPIVVYEEVSCESVEWNRLRWDRSVKSWDRIGWACIDYTLDRDELIEQFGSEIGNRVTLDVTSSVDDKEANMALIHEIFDIKDRKTYVISGGLKDEFLAVWDDPLQITGYLPFPKPLMANLKSSKLEPKPEYLYYQEQALELNIISKRISKLVGALKVRGAYDSNFSELADIATADDNHMVSVDKLTTKLNGGNIDQVLKFMPLNEIVLALQQLYRQREEIKQVIYELTGISDIVRGVTKASETLGAQEIKKGYATLRIARKQSVIQDFIRDIFRIQAEIIAEHFSDGTIALMTGMNLDPQAMEMIRSDVLRRFNIAIETDSTIQEDQSQEKHDRAEAVKAISGIMKEYAPLLQAGLVTQDVFKEILMFTLRAFKGGRTLENAIEQMQLGQNTQQMQQPGQKQSQQVPQLQRPGQKQSQQAPQLQRPGQKQSQQVPQLQRPNIRGVQ